VPRAIARGRDFELLNMTYESLQEFAGTADASGARPPPIPRAMARGTFDQIK
jgi:hypothetical protein